LVGVLKKKNETGVSEARQSLLRQVHRTIKLHLTEASSTAEDGRQSKYRKKKEKGKEVSAWCGVSD
jgi:hypothetical protein